MSMKLKDLTQKEYVEIIKVLPLDDLRTPIQKSKRLTQTYCTGFRPNKLPANILGNIYFQEISIKKNSDLENTFKETAEKYFDSINMSGIVERLNSCINEKDVLDIAMDYAEANIEVSVSTICNLFSINFESHLELTETVIQVIQQAKSKTVSLEKELNDQVASVKKTNDYLIRERDSLKAKNHQYAQDLVAYKERIDDCFKESQENDKTIKKLKEEQENTLNELDKLKLQLEEYQTINSEMLDEIGILNRKIDDLSADRIELMRKYDVLENSKSIEYEETIHRMVEETLSDIKDKYKPDLKTIKEIVETIEGPHTVKNVWDDISLRNLDILESIEAALQSEHISYELVDCCDEIENYIFVKYTIIKAIKSLIFEMLSDKEKDRNLSDIIQ